MQFKLGYPALLHNKIKLLDQFTLIISLSRETEYQTRRCSETFRHAQIAQAESGLQADLYHPTLANTTARVQTNDQFHPEGPGSIPGTGTRKRATC